MSSSPNRYDIFLKVTELGNITLAAEALNYTQSGVSHAVAALEKEAGCTLFHRSKTGVTLTENGKALLPLIRDLVEKQNALGRAMDSLSNRVAGVLRVGSFTSFTATYLPGLIRAFTEKHPEARIELTNGIYSDIEGGISEGRLDAGFLTAIENDPLEFTPLFRDPMLLIAAPDHPLASRSAVPLEELRKHPMISQFRGSDNDVQQIYRKARIRPRLKYLLDDDISVMGMVAQKEGIALMPRLMLSTAGFDLAAIPLDPPQYRTIGLASLPLREPTLLFRTFREFCRSYIENLAEYSSI